jgi:hypothetical protein
MINFKILIFISIFLFFLIHNAQPAHAQSIGINFIASYPSLPTPQEIVYVTVVATTPFANARLSGVSPAGNTFSPELADYITLFTPSSPEFTTHIWVYRLSGAVPGEYNFVFTHNNGEPTGITGKVLVVEKGLPKMDRKLIFGINPTWADWVRKPVSFDTEMADMVKYAGAKSTRTGLDWCNIEPTPGNYLWDEYDRRINLFLERGIEVIGLICTTPEWATAGHPLHQYPPKEMYALEFIKFCKALAEHYKGKIKYYEFWNEANGYGWHARDAAEYTKWLIRCYYGLKLGDPECLLSTTGLDSCDVPYLREIYNNGGKYFFDAVSLHPYNKRGPIDIEGVKNIYNEMSRNGDAHKTIWITEFGWDVNLVGEVNQALFLKQSLDYLISEDYNYVTQASYHTISDFSPTGDPKMGLCDIDLHPRQAYHTFKSYTIPIDTTPPPIPSLCSPPDGSVVELLPLNFDWEDVEDINNTSQPVRYNFQLDNDIDFLTPEIDTTTLSSEYLVAALQEGKYYWRVRSVDSAGNSSNWSSTWSIVVRAQCCKDTTPPPIPLLRSPPNECILKTLPINFDWEDVYDVDNLSPPVAYNFQLDNNNDFSSPEIDTITISSNYLVSHIREEGKYYWRVEAIDSSGNRSGWSSTWSIRVEIPTFTTPYLYTPTPSVVKAAENKKVQIEYFIPTPCRVSIKIYTLSGELVRTVAEKYVDASNTLFTEHWDMKGNDGGFVHSGVYIVHLKAGATAQNKKIIVLK